MSTGRISSEVSERRRGNAVNSDIIAAWTRSQWKFHNGKFVILESFAEFNLLSYISLVQQSVIKLIKAAFGLDAHAL